MPVGERVGVLVVAVSLSLSLRLSLRLLGGLLSPCACGHVACGGGDGDGDGEASQQPASSVWDLSRARSGLEKSKICLFRLCFVSAVLFLFLSLSLRLSLMPAGFLLDIFFWVWRWRLRLDREELGGSARTSDGKRVVEDVG